MKRLALFSTILTVALAVIAITALAQSEAAPMAPAQTARVRVVHAIPDPDAPAVDVYVDGGMAFGGAAFKDVTDYAKLPNGDYLVQVVVSGTTDLSAAVFSQTLTLSDTDYTVVAMGTLTTTDAYTAQLQVYEDDNTLPASGQARVRFIHLSPDAPAVNVMVEGGDLVLFEDVGYKKDGYTSVPAGMYNLEVRLPPGTLGSLLLPFEVTLRDGFVYTVFAMGRATGPGSLETPLEPVVVVDRATYRLFLPMITRNYMAQ
jgi:hypothetical protein